MNVEETRYYSYLLRLWRTDSFGEAVWRIMLEDTRTGTRYGFTGFADMTTFLNKTVAQHQAAADLAEGGDVQGQR